MAQAKRMAKFKRVTDLFEVGRLVVLDDDPTDPVCVWVNKINPFEQEEARKDGQVGRARAQMRLEDPDSPETAIFDQTVAGRTVEQLTNGLVNSHYNEDYVAALDDVRALEGWADKLDVLERGDAQLADAGIDDPDEAARLAALNGEYLTAVAGCLEARQQVRRDELASNSAEELRAAYRTAYLDQAGSNGFLTEYRTTELYFAVRDCVAKPRRDGGYDHGGCDHRERLCETRGDIRELPEGLLDLVRSAITDLAMTPATAGNSDAPASSSASSERPAAEVASTPSTQDATSPAPAGTS